MGKYRVLDFFVCVVIFVNAFALSAQENTSSFLYRLNGDFSDGTFSTGNQYDIPGWQKPLATTAIYTAVVDGKKILKFAAARTLNSTVYLPAGNYTLRMSVPAYQAGATLGNVNGQAIGFWTRLKQANYLDSDITDGMSDGVYLVASALTSVPRILEASISIPTTGTYTIEMKSSGTCNINIDWIELTANKLLYTNNYNVFNSSFKTITTNPYIYYDLKGWKTTGTSVFNGTSTNDFCGSTSDPVNFNTSNLLFSDNTETTISQKISGIPAGNYLIRFDCAGLADEATLKLSTSISDLISSSFSSQLNLDQQSITRQVTIPKDSVFYLSYTIIPTLGKEVRLSNIELARINNGIYNGDFSNFFLGWHFDENVGRESVASSTEKGYYLTQYPYAGEHNEVIASQYVTGIDPGMYHLECLLATEVGATTQDTYRLMIQTGTNADDRDVSVNLGDLPSLPVVYTANGYNWYKVSTMTFPVRDASQILKISSVGNSGVKLMVDDINFQFENRLDVKTVNINPLFKYLVSNDHLFLDQLDLNSTIRLYNVVGELLYENKVLNSNSLSLKLPVGQKVFLLEVRSNGISNVAKIITR